MDLEPTRAEEIAAACADLRPRGAFPADIARGLEANDPDQMRAAVTHLLNTDRVEGLRALVERFWLKRDFGVWARVTSAHLHRAAGEFAASVADIDDCMARFPARAGPHWWIAKARGLEGLGRGDEAAAAAREGAARFPDAPGPAVFLANLLSRLKRPEDALQAWRAAFAAFAEPELPWFVGLSNTLKSLGREPEALAALEDGVAHFPKNPDGPPLLAEAAEERRQWDRALALWRAFARAFPGVAEPRATLGRARALFRLEAVEEAVEILEALLAREPDNIQGLRERAAMAAELGETERARDLWLQLTQNFAETSRPEWWASLARAHNDLQEHAAGAEALAELERRFPKSALAEGERLRLAREWEHGHDDLADQIAAALRRFPSDFNLRAHWVWILLSLGRLSEAEREVEALEAEQASGFALAARLRLEADRGDENLRGFVERFAPERQWTQHEAIQIAYALHDVRTAWAFRLGGAIVDSARKRFGDNVRLNHPRIRLMIARREDAEAIRLIDAIPSRYVRREYLELRAWAAAKRERHGEAKSLWAQALARNYYPAVDAPIQSLTRISPDARPGPEAGVTAYVVFRNEAPQMPGFLAHHRRLGVKRFVFFDHQSSDDGRALALCEPDVILYDCPDSYQLSSSGRRWVQEIVSRDGARGWGLQLDMDEYLIYPGCERAPLSRFIAYLESHGYEGVRGYMLDVFPRRLVGENGEDAPISEFRFYDDDYEAIGLERPPYLHPNGGVRARLFQAKEVLHKVPLWRLDAGKLINSHETTHLKFADVSSALLHYKLANVALRGRRLPGQLDGAAFLEADADVEVIRRHARYAARLAPLWRADLVKAGVSRELADSLTLADRGLMDISDAYRYWLSQPPGEG